MKTLIATLALAFAFTASARSLHPDTFNSSRLFVTEADVLSCVTEEGHLVKINFNYGEIVEMDQQGNILLDYDDGYDWQSLQLESFPAQESVHVWHHEEPDVTVVSLRKVVGDSGPYKGSYLNTNGETVSMNCLK